METRDSILAVLENVKNGELSVEDAFRRLKTAPFEDMGYAKPDHHRSLRQGVPEVIYGQSKTPDQIKGILASMEKQGCVNILVTRMDKDKAREIEGSFPLEYYEEAALGVVFPKEIPVRGKVLIVTGGTSDMGVAREAQITATVTGSRVECLYDVGVAGIHRLLSNLDTLMSARVVVAVAGMEGALASVVGGLVDVPVIAVPTSIGYGASFGGLSALLSMLNSCSSGVSVVNIDNGFGAGFLASRINLMEGLKD